MKSKPTKSLHQCAVEILLKWRERGCEFVSITDGLPTPWEPRPIKLIMAEAERHRLEVLSLADATHVERVLAALLECIELGLSPTGFAQRGSA
jgi:hypothetical protein